MTAVTVAGIEFKSFLLEDAPPAPPIAPPKRCPAADLIRYQIWHSPPVLRFCFLDELRAHVRTCLRCIHYNANPTGVIQPNPDLTHSEILSGELDNTRHHCEYSWQAPAPATLPERTAEEMEGA